MIASMTQALGFDIGGSSIKWARVDTDTGRLLSELRSIPLPAPAGPVAVLRLIRDAVPPSDRLLPVGIGYPGVIKRGVTLTAAHMDPSFIAVDWLAQLRAAIGPNVALLNDADAAGLAELHFGAGTDFCRPEAGTVLVLTLGTGIGSALFHGGQLLPNTEFGHLRWNDRDIEDIAAASVRVREKLVWPEYAAQVNLFLGEMDRLLSPDLVIVGGGISENFNLLGPHLVARARIVPARLGNAAGLIGAALYAARASA